MPKRLTYNFGDDTYYCGSCAENIGFPGVVKRKFIKDFMCECEDHRSYPELSLEDIRNGAKGRNNTDRKLRNQS